MEKDELIEDLSKLLAGLAVPYSLGGGLLGAATKPFLDLRSNLGLFGYPTPEEIEEKLRMALEDAKTETEVTKDGI